METILKENKIISKSLLYMSLGLFTSFVTSLLAYALNFAKYMANGYGWLILTSILIGSVLIFSRLFNRLNPLMCTICFLGYSILNGLTLSSIFMIYNLNNIIYIFAFSAFVFFTLYLIARNTSINMKSTVPYFVIFISSIMLFLIVNIIFFNTSFSNNIINFAFFLIISYITIYNIKHINSFEHSYMIISSNLPIYFAFSLYLDFINLFVNFLNLSKIKI